MLSPDPGDPVLGSIGECTLPSANVLAGTGGWMASYAGTGNYHGAADSGYLDGGQTSPEEAELDADVRLFCEKAWASG